MRLRVRFQSTLQPYGGFLLAHSRDFAKVSNFLDSRLERHADCVIELDTLRSDAEHKHYMALVGNAYANLPEGLTNDFLNADHLRKWALCKTGYCDRANYICTSKAEARRLAAALQDYDPYVIAEVAGRVVTSYRAHSQSYEAMSAKQFRKSKADVLGILSALIGVSVDELSRSKSHGQNQPHRSDPGTRLRGRGPEEVPPEQGQFPVDETGRG